MGEEKSIPLEPSVLQQVQLHAVSLSLHYYSLSHTPVPGWGGGLGTTLAVYKCVLNPLDHLVYPHGDQL